MFFVENQRWREVFRVIYGHNLCFEFLPGVVAAVRNLLRIWILMTIVLKGQENARLPVVREYNTLAKLRTFRK